MTSWAAILSSTKPGLREKVGVEGEAAAAVADSAVEGEAEEEAAEVAVAVVAEAGTVTAAIAAAVAAETAAGRHLQTIQICKKTGEPRGSPVLFSGCQGTYYGLCFP